MRSMIQAAVLAIVLVASRAQMKGDVSPKEEHPKLNMEECEEGGACTSKEYSIVLDISWRWLHNVGGYTNCVGEDNKWADEYCPDGKTCSKGCAAEGLNSTQYSDTYGIQAKKDGSGVTLKYVPGSRVYLLDGKEYLMFQLKNKEFTFDIDLSTLPCGTNAALYLIEMAADGGGSDAGAAYGAGYCDAQCPQGMKFIDNEANVEDWGMTMAETPEYEWIEVGPVGKYGACCAEFDILEANNQAIAITSHPCSIKGLEKCEGPEECGNKSAGLPGFCDKDGCGLIPYRLGEPNFYGPGSEFKLDTSKPFTVVTQFVTEDNTDDGALVDIRRKYIQGGQVIDNAMASVLDEADQGNSLNDDICSATVKKFNVTKKEKHHKAKKSRTWMDTFKLNGGTEAMGEAIGRGMVMSLSVWDDGLGRMNWLDSEKTLIDEDITDPGVARGPCKFETGDPKKLRAENKQAYVTFSNLKMGPIGSTFKDDGSSSPPTPLKTAAVEATPAVEAASIDEAPTADIPEDNIGELVVTNDDDDDQTEDSVGELVVTDEAEDDQAEDSVGELVVTDEAEDDQAEAEPVTNIVAPEPELDPTPAPTAEAPEVPAPTAPPKQFTPTPGCEWIPEDNCMDTNEFACGCRQDNPDGPCTTCDPDSKKKTEIAARFELPARPLPRSLGPSSSAALAVAATGAVAAAAAAAIRRNRQSPSGVQLLANDEEAMNVLSE